MNSTSDQFFSGARFAGHQNRRLNLGDSLYHLIQRQHSWTASDDVAQLAARSLSLSQRLVLFQQRFLFFDERDLFQRARDRFLIGRMQTKRPTIFDQVSNDSFELGFQWRRHVGTGFEEILEILLSEAKF